MVLQGASSFMQRVEGLEGFGAPSEYEGKAYMDLRRQRRTPACSEQTGCLRTEGETAFYKTTAPVSGNLLSVDNAAMRLKTWIFDIVGRP